MLEECSHLKRKAFLFYMGHWWTTLILYFKKIVVGGLKPTLGTKTFGALSSIIITKY